MITDYSSVHFDFSYLNKPVIYYQYGNPSIEIPELGDSLIDEDACTFGAVIKEEEDLINKIKEYIVNDCKIEEEYRDRVINFFKFNDKNNCKRVYNWILNH
jgi:CDP-glycerol glycerophosphotransferase (TagB/SpsB family)